MDNVVAEERVWTPVHISDLPAPEQHVTHLIFAALRALKGKQWHGEVFCVRMPQLSGNVGPAELVAANNRLGLPKGQAKADRVHPELYYTVSRPVTSIDHQQEPPEVVFMAFRSEHEQEKNARKRERPKGRDAQANKKPRFGHWISSTVQAVMGVLAVDPTTLLVCSDGPCRFTDAFVLLQHI